MFDWLFKPKCPCDPAAKVWIERRLRWLSREFSESAFSGGPIITPTLRFFPETYDGSDAARWRGLSRWQYLDLSHPFDEVVTERCHHSTVQEERQMKRVEWQPYLSVGVAEIDRQHRVLFDRYNAFFAAYSEGLAAEEVVRLFGFLEAYVVTHFSDEEKLQQQVGFPGYLRHREHHEALTQQVLELKERLLSEGPTAALIGDVSMLMTGWLIEHINGMDRAVGRFVLEQESHRAAQSR